MYQPQFIHHKDIKLSEKTRNLLKQANEIYLKNFSNTIWYGRCIFFSWFCKKATCTFCYRSTLKHKIAHQKNHHRSIGSMLSEALLCKELGWRIEFLTGGYQEDNVFNDIVLYAKLITKVYGEKIWVNIGWMTKEQVEQLRPYIKGICASIETPTPHLHKQVCPDKPIKPYENMFANASDVKKSAAFIVGLGDTDEDFQYWVDFIQKQKLDRITVYALKPIKGGAFTQGPTSDQYLQWLAKLRIAFPKLEIIGGTNLRRSEEVGYMIRAGVNAITKFPATKQFATKKAHKITDLITEQDRIFTSNLTTLPPINWDEKIDQLDIEPEYKKQLKETFPVYLKQLQNPQDIDSCME
ncbi:MAG: radical SAM protein [Candidatus Woesearchaeota archaeon]